MYDHELRLELLRLAQNSDGVDHKQSTQEVLDRAKAYLEFIELISGIDKPVLQLPEVSASFSDQPVSARAASPEVSE